MRIHSIHPITQSDLNGTSFIDGRPCFAPDGNTVLFERAPTDSNQGSTLAAFFTVALNAPDNSQPLYASDQYACLRGSWSWNPQQSTHQIAFTGVTQIAPKKFESKIMLLTPGAPNNSAQVLNVKGYESSQLSYPAWYPQDGQLMVTDYTSLHLLKVDLQGNCLAVITPDLFMSGMGTVNTAQPNMLAFAGQPRKEPYKQDNNQVWIQDGSNDPVLFSSDQAGAIGRAPWFSPDGFYMVYEAKDSNGHMQIYIKPVAEPYPEVPATQVSHAPYFAQHAKFSPDGSRLVWVQQISNTRARIICASIEY